MIRVSAMQEVAGRKGTSMLLEKLNDVLMFLLHLERRFEPWFRPTFDRLFRDAMAEGLQYLINLKRTDERLALAQEKMEPGEEDFLQDIIDTMAQQMRNHFPPRRYLRGGNTKTHGLVRGTVRILDDLPANLHRGIFATPRTFPAWVRFSGPGPIAPPDIDDVGFVSMAIKLMDVPGPKLWEDERYTQDLICICTPTFVTPNTRANASLQHWSLREMPIYYFLAPPNTHILDMLMQSLWNETQYNPLGQSYYSCVPYLLGEGQAMQYAFLPRTQVCKKIPRLPLRPPDNYLRDNMIKTLAEKDVEFDITVQVQTDSFRMPIEDASVLWPTRLSPRVPVARLHIPAQKFDSPAQVEFVSHLSYNPWHCLPEHRPLGNQSRARKRLYETLSRFRQKMDDTPHIEPKGDEIFE
jgi:hypothetical protein